MLYTALAKIRGKLESKFNLNKVAKSYKNIVSLSYGRYTKLDKLNCILYKIPFSIELCNLRVISNTLVEQRNWDSLVVQDKLYYLLTLNEEGKTAYYIKWQKHATAELKKAMGLVERAERMYYGEKSYFKLCDNELEDY